MYEDPANCIINLTITAVRDFFSPTSTQPPLGGGTENIRLFAGDALPIAAWDAHREGDGCNEPFVWVRLARRYRSINFPAPYTGDNSCGSPVVVVVEVGVARCAAAVDPDCDWDCFQTEAEISADDSWRIERAMCHAAQLMRAQNCTASIGLDAVVPYGPDGGVVAWSGSLFAQFG
jgi:hypothetical protein